MTEREKVVFGGVTFDTERRVPARLAPAGPLIPGGPDPSAVAKVIASPPPAVAYGKVSTGAHSSIEYELNETAPYDASNAMLRALSPFVIRLEPPLIFQSDAAFLNRSKTHPKDVNVFRRARNSASRSGFFSARATLGSSKLATGNLRGSNPEEFIARSSGERFEGIDGVTRSTVGSGPSHAGNMGRPSVTDLHNAVGIATQLNALINTPPLVLLINPESMSMSISKVQNYSDRSREGLIFHAWGQEQEQLSITAKCGAFLSGGRGAHRASKKDSAAWQNFAALMHFYKNNGYIYDVLGKTDAHHMVGAVSITYDQWTYIGHMQSLSYAYEEADELGGTVFSMDFVVTQRLDHSMPVDGVVQPLRSPTPGPFEGDRGMGSSGSRPSIPRMLLDLADPSSTDPTAPVPPPSRVTVYAPNLRGFRGPDAPPAEDADTSAFVPTPFRV